jgi:3-dehydroquinate synthase
MKMKIKSSVKEYTLEMVDSILDNPSLLRSELGNGRPFFFIDKDFESHYSDKLSNFVGDDFKLLIDAKEENKEFVNLAVYIKALVDAGFRRTDTLVTFGGGVLQDISGFIASTLYRGAKWIFMPTTLLAQADSCIGSKTSINFGDFKNLIGSFYPPNKILVDPSFTNSLSDEHFNSGVGEIIKFHILSDENGYGRLLNYLKQDDLRDGKALQEIVFSTLQVKRSYFEKDEFDTGLRNLLNYGHCFGHALESASNFAVAHGEAVIVGMGFADFLARERGFMKNEIFEEFAKIFEKHYPKLDLSNIDADTIIHYLKRDKKRVTKDLTMIMGSSVGNFFKFDDVKEEEIRKTFESFFRSYPRLV